MAIESSGPSTYAARTSASNLSGCWAAFPAGGSCEAAPAAVMTRPNRAERDVKRMLTLSPPFLFNGDARKNSGEFRQFGFLLRSRRLRCFEQMSQSLKLAIELLDPPLECHHGSLKLFNRSVAVVRQAAGGRTGKIGNTACALSNARVPQGIVFFL